MNEANQIDYNAVLADLLERREKLDQAIAGIRLMLGQSAEAAAANGNANATGKIDRLDQIPSDAFFQMSVLDAIIKLLGLMKQPMAAKDIVAGVQRGGLISTSKNFYSTVFTALSRSDAKANGEVIKVNEKWGLAEWYGGRRQKRGADGDQTEAPKKGGASTNGQQPLSSQSPPAA